MNVWLFVIVNVAVAGTVGGVTNYLAIRMLFHPRQPWVVFGRRLPFTPGLIPKRKKEIAISLGKVVADYLVTPDAFRELFGNPEFRNSALNKLFSWVKREIGESRGAGESGESVAPGESRESVEIGEFQESRESRESLESVEFREYGDPVTVRGCLIRWLGKEKAEQLLASLPVRVRSWTGQSFVRLWEQGNWGGKRLREIVPGWNSLAASVWPAVAADLLLDELKRMLMSAEGQALLRKLAAGLIERQSGFIGMLAGIFVDEKKLVERLVPFLEVQLDSPQLREQVSGWLSRRFIEFGEMTLADAMGKMVSGDLKPEQMVKQWIEERLPWEEWAGKMENFPVGRWLAEREETWQRWLTVVFDRALDILSRQAPQLMEALRLQELVQLQVERFPVDQLERVILSISGREFRAITWLGVLLGGMIGLIQSFLIRLWPGG